MPKTPAPVIDALNKRDLPAFKGAVDALDQPIDRYSHCGVRLLVWVARQEFGGGVAHLLDTGAEPVSSALQQAIFFGRRDDISAIEALVDGGVDVDNPVDGQSPLGWVASINSGGERAASIVRLLTAHGANPEGHEQPSPLHLAVRRPASSAARALLEAGADPNGQHEESTPTEALMLEMRAAFKRDKARDDGSASIAREFVPETLRALIDHDADTRRPLGTQGHSPLLLAVSCDGCPDEVVRLLCEADPDLEETIHVNGEEHIDLLAYALLTDRPHRQQLAMVQAGFPLTRAYDILGGGSYLTDVAQRDRELVELLWHEGGERFRQALIHHRGVTSGIHGLTLCAVGGSETVVRALHAAGVSAKDRFVDGQSVADLVAKHAPAMLPLIEELAASESA